jgi:hypothetical protein
MFQFYHIFFSFFLKKLDSFCLNGMEAKWGLNPILHRFVECLIWSFYTSILFLTLNLLVFRV